MTIETMSRLQADETAKEHSSVSIQCSPMPNCARYQYKPLQKSSGLEHYIRLLDLLPAIHRNDPLQCVIRQIPIYLPASRQSTESPLHQFKYEALSYVWGKNAACEELTAEGGSLSIGENLNTALRRLRYASEIRSIWVDAICINQNDLDERNQQVLLMYGIYSQAQQVIIFLNDPTALPQDWNPKVAFDLARRLSKVAKTNPDIDMRRYSLIKQRFERLCLRLPRLNSSRYSALRVLFNSPWFERIWVVQEAACARRAIVINGELEISWQDLMEGTEYGLRSGLFRPSKRRNIILPVSSEAPRRSISAAVQMHYLAPHHHNTIDTARNTETESGMSLLTLLKRFHGSRASDPLDKYFALLGLASLDNMDVLRKNLEQIAIKPDYRTDTRTLFQDIAQGLLRTTQTLDLLSIPSSRNDWPTWIPDWSTATPEIEALSYTATPTYCCSRDSKANPRFQNDTLIVQGQFIDRISKVISRNLPEYTGLQSYATVMGPKHSGYAYFLATFSSAITQVIEWESQEHHDYPTGEHYFDVYQALLFAGRSQFESQWYGVSRRDNRGRNQHLKLRWMFDRCRHRKGLQSICFFTLGAAFGSLGPGDFDAEIAKSKTFAKTEKGYLVLAPARTRVGDSVAILQGGRTPFILGIDEPGGGLKLRGDCYVHGIMNGELYDPEKCHDINIT